MSDYFKFPSTKHILLPEEEKMRKDKAMAPDEITEMLSHEIVIEEKVDGANLGISFDKDGKLLLQNRGSWLSYPFHGQWEKLGKWINEKQDNLFDFLMDQYILFGEWCYATHSVYYDKLPDYFIGFDIFDKEELKFLSVKRRNKLLEDMGIVTVHQYAIGKYQLNDLSSFFGGSYYGNDLCEGIYIRWDENGWLKKRAKLVRFEFKQSITEHWRKKELKKNRVIREL